MALREGKTLNYPAEFLIRGEICADAIGHVVRVVVHVFAYLVAQYACEVVRHLVFLSCALDLAMSTPIRIPSASCFAVDVSFLY